MSLIAPEVIHDEQWFRSRIGLALSGHGGDRAAPSLKQIDPLWQHNHKRRAEIVGAQKHLTKEIEAIKSKINGAIWSFAVAAAGAVVILLKPKLGL